MSPSNSNRGRLGGRPPKFNEPSRPVTVTLPDRTLEHLHEIDHDRAKAIVKAVDVLKQEIAAHDRIETVQMADGAHLLLVPPNRSLKAIPWLRMLEVAPGRNLLLIDQGTPVERFEVALIDLIQDARKTAPEEVPMLEILREKLGSLRRGGRLSKAEVLCITTA